MSADEMFEELGYKRIFDNEAEIVYEFNEILMGDKCIHKFLFAKVSKLVFSYGEDLEQNCGFGMQELKAINKKCEELRVVIMMKFILGILVGYLIRAITANKYDVRIEYKPYTEENEVDEDDIE